MIQDGWCEPSFPSRRQSMKRFRTLHVLALLATLCGCLLILSQGRPLVGFAQGGEKEKGEKVRFTTVDGVELHGRFYAGKPRGQTIMMLHALNSDSRKKSWINLAETLQKEGYSVLTFDFRGHGQSTEVEASDFWKYPPNASMVKGAPKKTVIEYKDMSPSYFPVLVNDIAAAKAFLDNRNDGGACNTASTILIGAESGAALGALWLQSEWIRHRMEPAVMVGFPPVIANQAEGQDVIGAVWLSPTGKLGSRTVALGKLMEYAGKDKAVPMVFMYGDGDDLSKGLAINLEKYL